MLGQIITPGAVPSGFKGSRSMMLEQRDLRSTEAEPAHTSGPHAMRSAQTHRQLNSKRDSSLRYPAQTSGPHAIRSAGILLSLICVIHLIEITLYQAMFQRGPISGHPGHRTADTEAPNTDTHKTTILTVGGNVMDNRVPKYVTRARASFLLGLPEAELNRIAKESELGHVERAGKQKETYFTYEELQRICLLAACQMETIP